MKPRKKEIEKIETENKQKMEEDSMELERMREKE